MRRPVHMLSIRRVPYANFLMFSACVNSPERIRALPARHELSTICLLQVLHYRICVSHLVRPPVHLYLGGHILHQRWQPKAWLSCVRLHIMSAHHYIICDSVSERNGSRYGLMFGLGHFFAWRLPGVDSEFIDIFHTVRLQTCLVGVLISFDTRRISANTTATVSMEVPSPKNNIRRGFTRLIIGKSVVSCRRPFLLQNFTETSGLVQGCGRFSRVSTPFLD